MSMVSMKINLDRSDHNVTITQFSVTRDPSARWAPIKVVFPPESKSVTYGQDRHSRTSLLNGETCNDDGVDICLTCCNSLYVKVVISLWMVMMKRIDVCILLAAIPTIRQKR